MSVFRISPDRCPEASESDDSTMDVSYDWQEIYAAVLLEFEPARLANLIEDAESAIFFRLQLLAKRPYGKSERQAIADATIVLMHYKKEILKYPLSLIV